MTYAVQYIDVFVVDCVCFFSLRCTPCSLIFITLLICFGFFLRVEICITQSIKSLQSIAANSKASGGPEPSQVMVLPSLQAKYAKLSLNLF